jgi:type I restriction enzyme M protein
MLFIDARKLGFMVDRTRKEFSDADIARITDVYHAWRLGEGYADVPGFCKSASIEDIRSHGHVLTPGRYVGAEAAEEDETPFVERFDSLQEQLETQFADADALTAIIRARLAGVRL